LNSRRDCGGVGFFGESRASIPIVWHVSLNIPAAGKGKEKRGGKSKANVEVNDGKEKGVVAKRKTRSGEGRGTNIR
jgi:hypothetical protein